MRHVVNGGTPESRTCETCGTHAVPGALFCHRCGSRFAATATTTAPLADDSFHAERRHVTILFCDLVNSVGLAAGHDPEDVAVAMGLFHATIARTMRAHGGFYERPMGDGGLFYFGYPTTAEDDCQRAIEAALATIAAVAAMPPQLGMRLAVRIGISSGVVVVGDLLGGPNQGGRDVIGDVANLAARLQQMAEPGSVLVTETVHRATRSLFDHEDLGPVQLRGWEQPWRVWRPRRRVPYTERFSAAASPDATPLIGRHEEIKALSAAWRDAEAGLGRVVLLSGEAGLGKSRLVREMLGSVIPGNTPRGLYTCSQMQQDVALHPIIEQIGHLAGITASDPPAARREKVAAVVGGDSAAGLIADLVVPGADPGGDPDGPGARVLPPAVRRERILQSALAMILRPAAHGPLLILMEDAHWADPTTTALLRRLAGAVAGRPILLLVTARPSFTPDWLDGTAATRLSLAPLSGPESTRLVHAALGDKAPDPDLVANIVARSDGVPLFLEEVARGAVETGGGGQNVPVSIHASLQARIGRLGGAARVAEAIAAIGGPADPALLAAVCEQPAASIDDAVRRMEASGLLTRGGEGEQTRHAFRHALIRETAYSAIVRDRKRALHARIATVLEHDFAAEADANPARMALHHTAAGQARPAAHWLLRAGLQSLRRSAMTEALTQMDQALALLEQSPADREQLRLRLEILVVRAKALLATLGHAAAATGEACDEARALCEQLGDPPELLTVLFLRWGHAFFRCRLDDARTRAADLLRQARRRSEGRWMVIGYFTSGFTTLLSGDIVPAIGDLREGIAGFDPDQRDHYAGPTVGDPRVVMRTYLGWGLMMRGRFREAETELDAAVDEARSLQQPWVVAQALALVIYLRLELRGPDAAVPLLDELTRIAARIDYYAAVAEVERGWLLAARGDIAGGLAAARDGRARQVATGTRLHLPTFLRAEATMLLALKRPAEAMASLAEGQTIQAETGEHWDDPEFERRHGEALLGLGRAAEGEDRLRRAMDLSERRGQHWLGLRAALPLARHLAVRGQATEAMRLVSEARGRVEDDPGVIDVAAADGLLTRLGVAA